MWSLRCGWVKGVNAGSKHQIILDGADVLKRCWGAEMVLKKCRGAKKILADIEILIEFKRYCRFKV
jgi:hypothetical protein